MGIDQARAFHIRPRPPVPKAKVVLRKGIRRINGSRNREFQKLANRAGNTEATDLSNFGLNVPNGNKIIAKLEFQNVPTNSHYDRIYPYLFWCWERTGISPETHDVIETSSGNATPAFANVAKRLGYSAYCVLPNEISELRRGMSKKEGGIVVVSDPEKDGLGVVGASKRQWKELVGRIKERKGNPKMKQLMSINHSQVSESLVPMRILVDEVLETMLGRIVDCIDCFVGVAGNGTTLYGIGSEMKTVFEDLKIIALEPRQQAALHRIKYPDAKIREDGEKLTEIIMPGSGAQGIEFPHLEASAELVDRVRLVEAGEWVNAREKFEACSGIALGHTSAASLMVAMEYAQQVENQVIFTIFYDLLERY